mgnify:CR=1 FL=1
MDELVKFAMGLLLLSLVAACDNEGDATKEIKANDHVWSTQTEALEKAKQVEKLILDASDEKRNIIKMEEQ